MRSNLEVFLRVSNPIRDPVPTEDGAGAFAFRTAGTSSTQLLTTVSASGDSIETSASTVASAELIEHLGERTDIEELPEELHGELRALFSPLSNANHRIWGLIKQELKKREKHAIYAGTYLWSTNQSHWREITWGGWVLTDWSHSVPRLDQQSVAHIQELLDIGESALIATHHLDQAFTRSGARFQWIDATIAAELAIKETLLRLEPRLSALLLEVPSPPLHKLYGVVLEAVAGERSPYVSVLAKGATRRNELIHRPGSPEPSSQQVRDYVHEVEAAVGHLLRLTREHTRRALQRGA